MFFLVVLYGVDSNALELDDIEKVDTEFQNGPLDVFKPIVTDTKQEKGQLNNDRNTDTDSSNRRLGLRLNSFLHICSF